MNDKIVLTSVKVNKEYYDTFKKDLHPHKLNLQDLVNKALYLYNINSEFKSNIIEFQIPLLSSNNEIPSSLLSNLNKKI